MTGPSWAPATRSVSFAAAVLCAVSMAACTSGESGPTDSGAPGGSSGPTVPTVPAVPTMTIGTSPTLGPLKPLAWSQIALPAGHVPVTLTAYGGRVLVGTVVGEAPGRPGLVQLGLPSAQAKVLTVTPASGYGSQATWLSIEGTSDGGLVGVGGARGGAHSNVRWSVWRGDATGLREQEQVFSTFGGWGAGDQLGVIPTSTEPMLLGTWESRQSGLDADVWLPVGATWVRQDPSGTVLASTKTALVGPQAGTAQGASALVVGSVVELGEGARERPAAWVSRDGNSGWRELPLIATGSGATLGVGCREIGCLMVGRVDGRLAAWQVLTAEGQSLADVESAVGEGVPAVAVSDAGTWPAPRVWRGRWTVAVPTPTSAAGGTPNPRRESILLVDGPGGWERRETPPGAVIAMAVTGQTLYAVLRSPSGEVHLWATQE
ncbi:MAG: hypothetical protein IPN45_02690 [Actinomycetales bacterium]|nr:hypothetical protein [Actinomycetales bacterium]